MNEKIGFGLSLGAGVLLTIGGAVGSAGLWGKALSFAQFFFDGTIANLFGLAVWAVTFLASLGGIAVIVGGVFLYWQRSLAGRIIIGLGAGASIVALLAGFVVNTFNGVDPFSFLMQTATTTAGLGTLLAIAALIAARFY
jgi:hypothetical protein